MTKRPKYFKDGYNAAKKSPLLEAAYQSMLEQRELESFKRMLEDDESPPTLRVESEET